MIPPENDHLPHRMQRWSTRPHVLGLARRNACRRSPKVEWRRSEGGTATVGRWNPPKDFGHLIGDLLDMSTSAPRGSQPSVSIGAELWSLPSKAQLRMRRLLRYAGPTVTGLMARTRRRRGRRRADLRSSAFVPTYKCPASDMRASGREKRHDAGPLSATPASRRTPKADKRRTEGGSDRPISAPSMWIVCHEALRAGPVQGLDLLPNAARRRLAEYRRWTNGGRKVEPTDQFWPRHWRSIGYEHCNDETVVAVISPDRGRSLAPSVCKRGCN